MSKLNIAKEEIKDKKVFISGQMTGLQKDEYEQNFLKAKYELIIMGFNKENIISPDEILPPDEVSLIEALEIAFSYIDDVDYIYMLSNFKNSLGANMELLYAEKNNKGIIYQ